MKRRLSRDEAQLWARVADTVVPLEPGRMAAVPISGLAPENQKPALPRRPSKPTAASKAAAAAPAAKPGPVRPLHTQTLDSTWDRRLARGLVAPDYALDLHGHSLDAAHARLGSGLMQAKALGARLVLVITGRPRPSDAADRGSRRGAIRAKVLDWLAHGEHGADIAAVRGAHRRHGGDGAVYIVLRRRRA